MKIFDRQRLLDYIARRNADSGVVPTPEQQATLEAFVKTRSIRVASIIIRGITGRR